MRSGTGAPSISLFTAHSFTTADKTAYVYTNIAAAGTRAVLEEARAGRRRDSETRSDFDPSAYGGAVGGFGSAEAIPLPPPD